MDDISNGRINCANLTDAEWLLLEHLHKLGDWYLPNDDEWLILRGVMSLVEIRRGYRPTNDGTVQFGWPNIKINVDGAKALAFRRDGKVYSKGRPSTVVDILAHPVIVECIGCKGSGLWNDFEDCMDCGGAGYTRYA